MHIISVSCVYNVFYPSKELSDHLKQTLKMRQKIKERVYRSKQLASNYAKLVSDVHVSTNFNRVKGYLAS